MQTYPKHIKRKLRELSMLAYEEELKRALTPLAEQFDAWKQGQIGAGELSEQIHRYDTGISRELFKRYNDSSALVMQVAYAVVEGLLRETDIPQEVMPYLENALHFYRTV
jgi:hypothetical protein